nr:MAG TPA: hypothetical protein [Caudoviricetes sp.]
MRFFKEILFFASINNTYIYLPYLRFFFFLRRGNGISSFG